MQSKRAVRSDSADLFHDYLFRKMGKENDRTHPDLPMTHLSLNAGQRSPQSGGVAVCRIFRSDDCGDGLELQEVSVGQRFSCVHVSDNGPKGIIYAQKFHNG